MGGKFSVEDNAAIAAFFEKIGKKALARATKNSLNKTAVSVRAQISIKAREEITLKASDIKDAVQIERAKGSNPEQMRATVTIEDQPIPLEQYGGRPRTVKTNRGPRIGVTVKVKKSGTRAVVGRGFIAAMRYSKGIFVRRADGSREVKRAYGPSIRQLFQAEDFARSIMEYAAKRFESEFASSYQEFLRQEMSKGK